jgi:hypothetical protein
VASFVFKESRLTFTMRAKRAFQWDTHPGYRDGCGKLAATKAVDFCVVTEADEAFLIEVKNIRDYVIPNKDRDWRAEIERKVRDTLASLLWASARNSQWKPDVDTFVSTWLKKNGSGLMGILWLEEDQPGGELDALTTDLSHRLRSLGVRALAVSTATESKCATPKLRTWLEVVGSPNRPRR